MNLIIKTKDFQLTPAIEEYANKRIGGLEKFISGIQKDNIRIEVELGYSNRHRQSGDIFRSEINLTAGGNFFRAESEQATIQAAIDETRDDLERQIRKFKNKQDTIFIRGARSLKKKFGLSPLARFRKK
jgi:putative sigma-54 modulation protein